MITERQVKKLQRVLRDYFAHKGLAHLSLTLVVHKDKPPVLWIHNILIRPDARGGGVGSDILLCLCLVADAHKVTMRLEAVADEGYQRRLERWYKGFGFTRRVVGLDRLVVMTREPQS